ncbi:conserved hypothetical protein [Magnetococcus marinus MC-1]|uniref:NnrS family protein n=1 Tax=Magnetococcus marinus (strain ATCC BAA-1437 / JCM 17883 / MC-1) TaxID=156889 RepID=A0LD94_MAGMM|nr:hypothetical protein [Magnetococcus marinus]ABK45937.1 conserved hypothetical protein [Magnetococcus marinus MC-1]
MTPLDRPTYARYLPRMGMLALLCLIAYTATAGWLPSEARSHVVVGAAILPLILANILYFSATLTRSSQPPASLWGWPLLGLLAGLVVIAALSLDRRWALLGAVMAMVAVLGTLNWIRQRRKQCLGDPHPGLRWYEGALVSLLLGLVAISGGLLMPDYWAPLRSMHLHLNLIGFVGMTAISTMQVLLPTAAKFQDTDVVRRLHQHAIWAMGGSLAFAVGAAGLHLFYLLGLGLWLRPLGAWILSLWGFRDKIYGGGGATWPLLAALAGFMIMMFAGLLVALGWLSAQNTLPLFFIGFLFPLLTGALTQLLPLWWWPGLETPLRSEARSAIELGSPGRAAVYLVCGVGAALGYGWAAPLAAAAVAQFLLQVLVVRMKTPKMPPGNSF